MNRPEAMNALHPAANAELAEIFDDFAADPSQWVAIITGAGERAFCTGNDLKFTATAMARGESFAPPLTGFAGLTGRFNLDKPVRSEEHTSELQSLMRNSYAVFCLKQQKHTTQT